MKIKLIFEDWKNQGKSIYSTEAGIHLSMGDFHSGTIFYGQINLDAEQHDELKRALRDGFTPSFVVDIE